MHRHSADFKQALKTGISPDLKEFIIAIRDMDI